MAFTLQLLHASDLEGGVDAIQRAPNFAALVERFETDVDNTLVLSAGDNWIPGPFFTASSFLDDSVFNTAANAAFGLPADVNSDGTAEQYEALEAAGGRVDASIMNIIGFDASALGNHEFDLGTGTVADIIAPVLNEAGLADDEWTGVNFPYLSANLDFSAESDLADLATSEIITDFTGGPAESLSGTANPRIAPAAIVDVNGESIGVVGATTPLINSISSPGDVTVEGSASNDMNALAAVLQPVIDQVIAQGVNKVVLVTHLQQIALEKELIGKLSGVDIIVAGGSDTLQADATDTLRAGDEAAEGYPFVTQNANGDTAMIVSTDGEYSYLGRLVVEFDDTGVINAESLDAAVSGAWATTDEVVSGTWGEADAFAEGTKGAAVQNVVSGVRDVVQSQDGNTFGSTAVYLDGDRASVRTEETNLGNLSADANLFTARQVDETVQVSIKNGGGIRAAIGDIETTGYADPRLTPPAANPEAGREAGEVSQLAISNALRFNNDLTLVTVTPEQLLQVLEHAVSESGGGNTPGQFPQIGGLRFSFDAEQPAGQRVDMVQIVNDAGRPTHTIVEDGAVSANAPASIRVVTLGFLADGGDDYPFADFLEADAAFANRVDLEGNAALDAGAATFADPGTEQDALAEYLAANYSDTAFARAETAPEYDTRIVQEEEVREMVAQHYAAVLGRTPDLDGLQYWSDAAIDQGPGIVGRGLLVSEEGLGANPFLAGEAPVETFITAVYQNAFGRDSEAEGTAYWADVYDAGMVPADLVLAILSGARGTDAQTLAQQGEAGVAAARAEAEDSAGITGVAPMMELDLQ